MKAEHQAKNESGSAPDNSASGTSLQPPGRKKKKKTEVNADDQRELDALKSCVSSQQLASLAQSKSKSGVPPEYDPTMAVKFERLEKSSFKQSFYEKMEELNYNRYIEMDKYIPPKFESTTPQ